jgi:hypothetical protein
LRSDPVGITMCTLTELNFAGPVPFDLSASPLPDHAQ